MQILKQNFKMGSSPPKRVHYVKQMHVCFYLWLTEGTE